MLAFPSLSDEDIESLQNQLGSLDEHITLLTAQSAFVHQKRQTLRERQRVHTTALSFLEISGKHSFAESENSDESVWTPYEQSKSRFSHSLLSLSRPTVEIIPPPLKRKSMIAKLLDGKLRSFQPLHFRLPKRSSKHDRGDSVANPKSR